MARFMWKDHEVVVREIDRATAIDISQRVIAFIMDADVDKLTFAAFLTNLLAAHSRVMVLKDGKPLPDGRHVIDDNDVILPINEDNFATQPASLAGQIVNVSETVNGWLLQSFLASALSGTSITPPSAITPELTP